jgi:hypothetical protein
MQKLECFGTTHIPNIRSRTLETTDFEGEAIAPEAFRDISVAALFCRLKEIWGNAERF